MLLNRTHFISGMMGILMGGAFYNMFEDFKIQSFFVPVWTIVLVSILGLILLKDAINEENK